MSDYMTYIQDVTNRSDELRKTLVDPFRMEDGTFLIPKTKAEAEERNRILKSAAQNSIFEMAGKSAPMIAGVCARALQGYEMRHKRQPSPDLLASAHKAIENVLLLTNGRVKAPGIFKGIEISTTEGIQVRDRLVSLVLPVYLTMITSKMSTFILGDFNQTEFFRITQHAGINFGSLKKGDVIQGNYGILYSHMEQTAYLGTGDGHTTSFSFDSKLTYSDVYPIKPKLVCIYLNKNIIGHDDGNGLVIGNHSVNGVTYTVDGIVNYVGGKVTVNIKPAPPADTNLEIDFDVDIIKNLRLLPKVESIFQNRILFPHEVAIRVNSDTFTLYYESVKSLSSLTMKIAAAKDRIHLDEMYYFCPKDAVTRKNTKGRCISPTDCYELIKTAIFEVNNQFMKDSSVITLSGIVAGFQALKLFLSLPTDYLDLAPGYHSTTLPHFVGRLFNSLDLFCDPQAPDGWSCLCYAKGPEHGQTAYVAGDAIPTLAFNDSLTGSHEKRTIIGELAYRDIQPFDGSRYLHRLTFTER